jgi:hypothetical protein
MAAPFRPGGRAVPDKRDPALTLAPDHIKAVLVSLAYSLAELRHSGDLAEVVDGLADVFRHRLDREQRGLMLVASAQAAEPADLEALAEDVVAGDGPPVPPFDNIRAEAEDWAAFASRRQVRAIIAASLAAMPAEERREILAAASRRVPA